MLCVFICGLKKEYQKLNDDYIYELFCAKKLQIQTSNILCTECEQLLADRFGWFII